MSKVMSKALYNMGKATWIWHNRSPSYLSVSEVGRWFTTQHGVCRGKGSSALLPLTGHQGLKFKVITDPQSQRRPLQPGISVFPTTTQGHLNETEMCVIFDKIFITVCIKSCQNDNFQYSHWWKFHKNDISVSVLCPHAEVLLRNKNLT